MEIERRLGCPGYVSQCGHLHCAAPAWCAYGGECVLRFHYPEIIADSVAAGELHRADGSVAPCTGEGASLERITAPVLTNQRAPRRKVRIRRPRVPRA